MYRIALPELSLFSRGHRVRSTELNANLHERIIMRYYHRSTRVGSTTMTTRIQVQCIQSRE